MRATKAYIASLGTTGVLLGASLLMLAVVSAVVAFNRWPDSGVSTRVQTLMLNDQAAPIRVSAVAPGARAGAAAAAARGAAARGGTVPRVLGRTFTGGRLGTIGSGPPPAPAQPLRPPFPITGPTGPIEVPNPSPREVGKQVADQAQQATDSAGATVGGANPQAGQAVTDGGRAVADALRQLPLPGPGD